jgi:hypothetical protein
VNSTAISPFVVGELTQVELADGGDKKKVWKKQILPAGTRNYKGQTLDFSKINPACLTAFEDGAFDSVPFVLALSDNQHPKPGQEGMQLEGDVVKLELADDGSLFGYFDLTHSAKVEETIKKSNGKFGVSGRIEVDYDAEDSGKHYEYALSHVCGTTRPHIKGMASWEPVNLSEEEKQRPVIDFSTEVIEDKDKDKDDDEESGGDLMAKLTPEQIDKLLALVNDLDDIEKSADDVEKDDKKEVDIPDEAKRKIAAAEQSASRALELAERMQVSAAEERWGAQRARYLTDGVPPVILDLAEKVMSRHRPVTLEFAEGDVVDATAVIQGILDECKGVVSLADERGHSFSDSRDSKKNTAYDKLEEQFLAQWAHDGRDS